VVLGLYVTLLVLRENTFSASNIRVEHGQTVISTGPYAILCHPMYAAALMMSIGVPLALGSWLGLAVVGLLIPVLVWRILDEERLLTNELPGYTDCAHHVRFRLVPFVW
jgi:protein-S-isoprenylcysteine O-methyltransferase Ste14